METTKRLYRSNVQRNIGGVAGGLAEYFDVDPVIVRLLFVVAALAGGAGIPLYILMWIFVPGKPYYNYTTNANQSTMENEQSSYQNPPEPAANPVKEETKKKKEHGGLMGGLILITLGVLFLIPTFIHWLDFGDLWPVLLIVIGGVIIYRHSQKQ